MALILKQLEPVQFGDFTAQPIVNMENMLRLSQINLQTADGRESAVKVMAECFPKDRERVEQFVAGLPVMELTRLQAYLIGGQTVLDALEANVATSLTKTIEEQGDA